MRWLLTEFYDINCLIDLLSMCILFIVFFPSCEKGIRSYRHWIIRFIRTRDSCFSCKLPFLLSAIVGKPRTLHMT